VRLGTCIAVELVCAAGAAVGVWFVATRSADIAVEYLGSHEAAAAGSSRAIDPLPGASLRVPAPAGDHTVYDAPDDVLLAPVAATPLVGVKLNHGGTSLSLRVEFASGARAAFKPQQTHPQSDPRREIAAYRIDRMLGIGHVPPAKPGHFTMAELIAATAPDVRDYTQQRLLEEAIAHGGVVRGELSWWIPDIFDARIGMYRIDETEGIAAWSALLQPGAIVPPELHSLVEQIATVIVFDVLIDNADRWTGNNTKCAVDRSTLYFMDNTLSFSIFTLGHETNLTPLHRISVFPRKLVTRLRALTYDSIVKAIDVGDDPLGPLLTSDEIRAVLARRDHLLQYVDALVAELGEKRVLALP
jgi:hypothetical protein